FKNLKEAELAQQNDAEAMKLLNDYNKVRIQLVKEINETQPSEERLEEIRNILNEEYEKMESNQTLSNFLKAQAEFSQMIDNMNAIIAYYVQGPQKDAGGCCGSSCSSCSSCG
ncbi:MAG: YlbF family regulator, partial [Clostridiaceae bacterium]|nr:YlbF family regulator [Clostridiaceae bacterium]